MIEELISVIIPVYNVEQYLYRCLSSIIEQTYKNLEIILVNDGSTDNSLEICNKFKEKDSRIIILNKENGGVSSARNLGLDNSHGEYILFIDSDDYLQENMVEILYENINLGNCDVSICNYKNDTNGICTQNNINNNGDKLIDNRAYIEGLLNPHSFKGYLWNKLIKRECIGEIRFNEKIHMMEDLVFLLEISDNITSAYLESEKFLYNYVQRKSSAIYNFNSKYISAINAYKVIFNYISINSITNKLILGTYSYNYVFLVMSAYYYLWKENSINKEIKNDFINIRKKYLKIALNNKEKGKVLRYIKIIFMSYFPILYGKLKDYKGDMKNEQ